MRNGDNSLHCGVLSQHVTELVLDVRVARLHVPPSANRPALLVCRPFRGRACRPIKRRGTLSWKEEGRVVVDNSPDVAMSHETETIALIASRTACIIR